MCENPTPLIIDLFFLEQEMLADIADVNLYLEAYKEIGSDHEAVPFGRIQRSTVEEAKDILNLLKTSIEDKETIEEKRG